jgi:hypothetical protein
MQPLFGVARFRIPETRPIAAVGWDTQRVVE